MTSEFCDGDHKTKKNISFYINILASNNIFLDLRQVRSYTCSISRSCHRIRIYSHFRGAMHPAGSAGIRSDHRLDGGPGMISLPKFGGRWSSRRGSGSATLIRRLRIELDDPSIRGLVPECSSSLSNCSLFAPYYTNFLQTSHQSRSCGRDRRSGIELRSEKKPL